MIDFSLQTLCNKSSNSLSSNTLPAKYARLGDIYLNGTGARVVSIDRVIVHSQYNYDSKINDIVLFRLNASQAFDDSVQPACLADRFDTPDEKPQALGWGATSWRGNGSNILQKVSLELYGAERCAVPYANMLTFDHASQICAASQNKDTCSVRLMSLLMTKIK